MSTLLEGFRPISKGRGAEMTRKLMEQERDRLARERAQKRLTWAGKTTCEHDFQAGFDTALELMEDHRVKPLREALNSLTSSAKTYTEVSDGPFESDEANDFAFDIIEGEKTLAQVEEWE